MNAASPPAAPIVAFEQVSLAFDDNVVLREISFAVNRGEMKILLGASGSGKSVVLKLILGLLRPDSGIIRLDGERIDHATEAELRTLRAGIGMLTAARLRESTDRYLRRFLADPARDLAAQAA